VQGLENTQGDQVFAVAVAQHQQAGSGHAATDRLCREESAPQRGGMAKW
jgi:hypothetical protein